MNADDEPPLPRIPVPSAIATKNTARKCTGVGNELDNIVQVLQVSNDIIKKHNEIFKQVLNRCNTNHAAQAMFEFISNCTKVVLQCWQEVSVPNV